MAPWLYVFGINLSFNHPGALGGAANAESGQRMSGALKGGLIGGTVGGIGTMGAGIAKNMSIQSGAPMTFKGALGAEGTKISNAFKGAKTSFSEANQLSKVTKMTTPTTTPVAQTTPTTQRSTESLTVSPEERKNNLEKLKTWYGNQPKQLTQNMTMAQRSGESMKLR